MITKQVIQTCIDDLKELTKVEFAVIDTQGILVAGNFEKEKLDLEMMKNFFDSPADSQIIGGNYLFKVRGDNEPVYVLVSHGNQSEGYVLGKIAVSHIEQLLVAYREQFDHNNFIQNLLLDNLLLVDIYGRAKKLHIPAAAQRVVIIIETGQDRDQNILESMQQMIGAGSADFVTAVDETSVVVFKVTR